MERYSVKKPFTVLVAVLMVLVLGVVSVTRMTTDLLPQISLPYMIVITTYPGASPERVEADVTEPMESGLGTISGVKNVYSTSAENYSMVQLEFEDGTDMDSAMVKVSSGVQEVAAGLPELCGTPSIMEISMDMMATMYVAVAREGYDIYQTSDYVKNEVVPYVERQEGVASVSSVGLVEQSVQVELDQARIDALNDEILAVASEKLADAKAELDKAEKQVEDGKAELAAQQASFGSTLSSGLFGQLEGPLNALAAQLKGNIDQLRAQVDALAAVVNDPAVGAALDTVSQTLQQLSAALDSGDYEALSRLDWAALSNAMTTLSTALGQLQGNGDAMQDPDIVAAVSGVQAALGSLSATLGQMPAILGQLQGVVGTLAQAQLEAAVGFSTATVQLTQAQTQLESAREQYETARTQALENANLDALMDVNTLSQLIYAQNFAMPAGYIDDADDNAWLLKVGDEYASADDIAGALLCSIDGVGDVRIADVADVTVIDNADESYARLNGENAVVLCIFKSSTAGTNEVSGNCLEAFAALQQTTPGVSVVTLMDQGDYITMIVNSVLSSMVLGALLAIVVLALFLKDLKPTLVVGVSIPLSVLFAIVLLYFTGLSLNMMTLSGLALGIGMLVDNSIVVMENIYRLRGRGINAPRAAVQGTKQVTGSIVASTLTTICVFMPLVFTTGTVRELLMPMGLSIAYCLTASLVMAMTVVPATASTILKNAQPKKHPWFDKVQEWYGASLDWCLRRKWAPLLVAFALLAACVWQVLRMGIVILPEMTSNEIQVNISTGEELDRESSYAAVDKAMAAMMTVDGVETVGVMDSGSTSSMMSASLSSGGSYGSYVCYVTADEDAGAEKIAQICADIEAVTADSGCTVSASAGGMSDMTSLMSSGLSVSVYGSDMDKLTEISQDVADIVNSVEGFANATNGLAETGDQTLHLVLDKDKAMGWGLTVAQVYSQIAQRLTTSASAATITVGGVSMDVTVTDPGDPLTKENLLQMEFSVSTTDEDGASVTETHTLGEFATVQYTTSVGSISRENQLRSLAVTADTLEGYNTTLLSRTLQEKLDEYTAAGNLPDGYRVAIGGESQQVNEMVQQMMLLLIVGLIFIYLVMVAQFQSLLSPFIVLFTVPLAFTGGLLGILAAGQQLSLLSLMGFVVLMGTVVNNGIVFVDYTNQLRMGGMERRPALIAAGKTRMRPILMTAMTTILAMAQLIFGDDMGSQLGSGMAIVVAAGLAYATLMTLYIVPVMYDILFKKQPLVVDVGGDNIDDVPDDAAEFIAQALAHQTGAQGEVDAENPADKAARTQPAEQPRKRGLLARWAKPRQAEEDDHGAEK